MKFLHKVLALISNFLAIWTIVIILCTNFAIFDSWIVGFMMIGLPILVIVNIIFVFFWLVLSPSKIIYPLIACLLALTLSSRTYKFQKTELAEEDSISRNHVFKILNYNVSSFVTPFSGEKRSEERVKMVNWIVDTESDVLCMPEYYSEKNKFDPNDKLRRKGYKYTAFTGKRGNVDKNNVFGLGLLSKHPIVFSKDTTFEMQNGLLLADIKIKNDTVRVIAVHLYSMTLRLYTLSGQRDLVGLKRESKDTFTRMKKGFKRRSGEYEALEKWVKESPYPVIVCGDFNETPYGYVYGQTRNVLRNAFEEGGSGFGYTFNKLPYFIRIDHQFYDDKRLKLLDFKTHQDVPFSDHYPLTGVYSKINAN